MLDEARIGLTVDAGGSVQTLDAAARSTASVRQETDRLTAAARENRQEQANVRREIAGLNEILRQNRADLAQVNAQLKETPSYHRRARTELEAHKKAIEDNTAAMRSERDTLRSRLGLYQAQGGAIQGQLTPLKASASATRQATRDTQELSTTALHSQQVFSGLTSVMQGNFQGLTQLAAGARGVAVDMQRMGVAGAGTATGLRGLVGLIGPGGLVLLGISALVAILPVVIDLLNRQTEAQKRAADAAKEHADEIDQLIESLRKATGAEAARGAQQAQRLAAEEDATIRRIQARLRSLQPAIDRANQALNLEALRAGAPATPEQIPHIQVLRRANELTDELNSAQLRRNRLLGDADQALVRNSGNLATQLTRLREQRDELVESGQAAGHLTRQIEALEAQMERLTGATRRTRGLTANQLRARAEAQARLVAEIEAELLATRREQEEAAIDETARRREAEARKLGLTLLGIEEARLRAQSDLAERYRQEEEQQRIAAATRAGILEAREAATNARERARGVFQAEAEGLAAVTAELQRQLTDAERRFGIVSAEYRRIEAQLTAAINAEAEHRQSLAEQEEAAAEQLRDRLVGIAQDAFRLRVAGEARLRAAGAITDEDRARAARDLARVNFEVDEAILQETLLRLRVTLAAEEQAGRGRAAFAQDVRGEIAEGEQNLAELQMSYAEAVARAQADAERERLQQIRRFTDAVAGVIEEALRHRSDITDLDIELQLERFAEEERNLRESYRNREVSAREFDLEMRRLAQERSEFEQRVEEDRAGFVARSWQGLTRLVIAEIQRQVAAWIAAQIIMGILTAGGSLLVPRNFATFAPGGFVGRRGESGRDRVPIVVGRGEAVINRHQQKYVEAALWEKYGWGLQALFAQVRRPHYLAAGGFADRGAVIAAARPVGYASGGFATSTFSDAGITSRLDRLERVAERQTRTLERALVSNAATVAGAVGDPRRARRLVQTAAAQERATDPRRRR